MRVAGAAGGRCSRVGAAGGSCSLGEVGDARDAAPGELVSGPGEVQDSAVDEAGVCDPLGRTEDVGAGPSAWRRCGVHGDIEPEDVESLEPACTSEGLDDALESKVKSYLCMRSSTTAGSSTGTTGTGLDADGHRRPILDYADSWPQAVGVQRPSGYPGISRRPPSAKKGRRHSRIYA